MESKGRNLFRVGDDNIGNRPLRHNDAVIIKCNYYLCVYVVNKHNIQ